MPQQLKGKQAVFICVVPPTFKPQRVWDFPQEILSAKLHAKNLHMRMALGFCRTFNKARLDALTIDHQPIGEWAFTARHLKPAWHDSPYIQSSRGVSPRKDGQEGGAA